MRILFMGTPDFAVPGLQRLIESGNKPVAVVTGLDKPKGRGQKLSPTPVRVCADEAGIEVRQQEDLSDIEFVSWLENLNLDLILVVAFRILPEAVINIPKIDCVNLHSSLLPRYRGAAPIQRAIMNGDTRTGVTTFSIQKKVDTGGILLKTAVDIGENENAGSLHDRLAESGADLLVETVRRLEAGDLQPQAQDDALATPAPKIKSDDLIVDWGRSSQDIHNQIRALSPYPGARSTQAGIAVKVYATEIASHVDTGMLEDSGKVLYVDDKTLEVGTANGSVRIIEIQRAGKSRMPIAEFLKGTPIQEGDKFE